VETATENIIIAKSIKSGQLIFHHFPGFARFIRENHLADYIKESLRLSREFNLPVLKHLAHIPEEQLIELSIPAQIDFFTCAENNELRERIERTTRSWIDDKMGILGRDDIAAEDITVGSYLRKQTLLKFLPLYTTDITEVIEIIKEIDMYEAETSTASANTYIRILREKINEHAHFIEKVTETTPGIVYVFDLQEKREIYTNHKLTDLLGYTPEEVAAMGSNVLQLIAHPDDLEGILKAQADLLNITGDEIKVYDNRMKHKDGHYVWVRSYRSIFKKDGEGQPVQIIGVTFDINEEKKRQELVNQSHEQLLEAQELAEMGSYVWNIDTNELQVTPQFSAIYETDDFHKDQLMEHVHPSDRKKINEARDKAIRENGMYDGEYRYYVNDREKIIWVRGAVSIKDGQKLLKGTVMDVTQRKYMIRTLERSEELYKQAEAMSHIGNWAWDLLHNKLIWSDELYRIYGLMPATEISYELIESMNHPDDVEMVRKTMNSARITHEPYDFYYRIILKDGTLKIVHARGEVLVDEANVPYKMVGTVQDVTEKQTLIRELQKSEELYKQAQAMSNIGNWEWDLAGNKITWSEEIYRIIGIDTSEKLVPQEIAKFVHPDDTKIIAEAEKAIQNLQPYNITYRIITKNGTIKYLNSKGKVIEIANGQAMKVVGTLQDVTEKQLMLEQLQKSDELYKQAQAMSHIGNWEWDIRNDKINWSDELYRIYGVDKTQGEINFERYSSLLHPEDKHKMQETIQNCIAHHQSYEIYHRIILDSGDTRWVYGKGDIIVDDKGEAIKLYGTAQDVTKQKLIEKQLNDNREFIQKIADTSPSLIASYNVNTGKYTYINSAFEKILGYDPAIIYEKGIAFFMDILHPDDIESLTEKNSKAMAAANEQPPADGKEMVVEFKYRMKNIHGQYRWFHTYGTIFDRNEQGKVEHVLNVSVDITDQEEAEQLLFQKNILLKHSNASLEEFAYIASHDLKEPLRKISTFGDRLITSQYETLNDDGRLYLTKIIDSSKRMQIMINDLLSISTISGNVAFEPYSLQQVLKETIQTLEYKIEAKKVIINADNLPTATIVPSQFRQLFQNIISNAIKFSKPGVAPVIDIKYKYLRSDDEKASKLKKAGRYLELTFTDNGIGLDNRYATKIFTIFQRLHGRHEFEGTGIGLAICKKIVENHGGIIYADGVLGTSSTFTVIIPA
jgi:PAS domain S-box-containing protein